MEEHWNHTLLENLARAYAHWETSKLKSLEPRRGLFYFQNTQIYVNVTRSCCPCMLKCERHTNSLLFLFHFDRSRHLPPNFTKNRCLKTMMSAVQLSLHFRSSTACRTSLELACWTLAPLCETPWWSTSQFGNLFDTHMLLIDPPKAAALVEMYSNYTKTMRLTVRLWQVEPSIPRTWEAKKEISPVSTTSHK